MKDYQVCLEKKQIFSSSILINHEDSTGEKSNGHKTKFRLGNVDKKFNSHGYQIICCDDGIEYEERLSIPDYCQLWRPDFNHLIDFTRLRPNCQVFFKKNERFLLLNKFLDRQRKIYGRSITRAQDVAEEDLKDPDIALSSKEKIDMRQKCEGAAFNSEYFMALIYDDTRLARVHDMYDSENRRRGYKLKLFRVTKKNEFGRYVSSGLIFGQEDGEMSLTTNGIGIGSSCYSKICQINIESDIVFVISGRGCSYHRDTDEYLLDKENYTMIYIQAIDYDPDRYKYAYSYYQTTIANEDKVALDRRLRTGIKNCLCLNLEVMTQYLSNNVFLRLRNNVVLTSAADGGNNNNTDDGKDENKTDRSDNEIKMNSKEYNKRVLMYWNELIDTNKDVFTDLRNELKNRNSAHEKTIKNDKNNSRMLHDIIDQHGIRICDFINYRNNKNEYKSIFIPFGSHSDKIHDANFYGNDITLVQNCPLLIGVTKRLKKPARSKSKSESESESENVGVSKNNRQRFCKSIYQCFLFDLKNNQLWMTFDKLNIGKIITCIGNDFNCYIIVRNGKKRHGNQIYHIMQCQFSHNKKHNILGWNMKYLQSFKLNKHSIINKIQCYCENQSLSHNNAINVNKHSKFGFYILYEYLRSNCSPIVNHGHDQQSQYTKYKTTFHTGNGLIQFEFNRKNMKFDKVMNIISVNGSDDFFDCYQTYARKKRQSTSRPKMHMKNDDSMRNNDDNKKKNTDELNKKERNSKQFISRHLTYQNVQILPSQWDETLFKTFGYPQEFRQIKTFHQS